MADKLVTPPVRLSFVSLAEARSSKRYGGPPKYSAVLLIPKSTAEGRALKKRLDLAREAAIQEGVETFSKWNGRKPRRMRESTIHDGDDSEKSPEHYGHWTLTASNARRPGIVDRDVQPIEDVASEMYSGVWARVALNCRPFGDEAEGGVTFYLEHVQKVRDDAPFGGATRAEDVFETFEEEDFEDEF